jgi:hypothetical protein
MLASQSDFAGRHWRTYKRSCMRKYRHWVMHDRSLFSGTKRRSAQVKEIEIEKERMLLSFFMRFSDKACGRNSTPPHQYSQYY